MCLGNSLEASVVKMEEVRGEREQEGLSMQALEAFVRTWAPSEMLSSEQKSDTIKFTFLKAHSGCVYRGSRKAKMEAGGRRLLE